MEQTGINIRKILPQSHWLSKGQGLNFVSFCNHQGSKTGDSKVPKLGCDRYLRTLPYSWSESRQTTLGQITPLEYHLTGMGGSTVLTFWSMYVTGNIASLGTKEPAGAFYLPSPQHKPISLKSTVPTLAALLAYVKSHLSAQYPQVLLFSGKCA